MDFSTYMYQTVTLKHSTFLSEINIIKSKNIFYLYFIHKSYNL